MTRQYYYPKFDGILACWIEQSSDHLALSQDVAARVFFREAIGIRSDLLNREKPISGEALEPRRRGKSRECRKCSNWRGSAPCSPLSLFHFQSHYANHNSDGQKELIADAEQRRNHFFRTVFTGRIEPQLRVVGFAVPLMRILGTIIHH
jgi:hypothetical protein